MHSIVGRIHIVSSPSDALIGAAKFRTVSAYLSRKESNSHSEFPEFSFSQSIALDDGSLPVYIVLVFHAPFARE